MKKLLATALLFNGSPSGHVQMATYNLHVADAQTKVVTVHAKSLQDWWYRAPLLQIETDQVFLQGFE